MKKTIVFTSLFALSGLVLAAGHGDHSSKDTGGHADMHHSEKMMKKDFHDNKFAKMDQNGDEKIDLQEYLANAEQRFNKIDADSDGFVTKDEAKAMRKEMKAQRAHKMMEADKPGSKY